MIRKQSREKGATKKKQKQIKKKVSPPPTIQPLVEAPESVALKSLLGVPAPAEEVEEEVEEEKAPSLALKSLLGVQNPKHQTAEVAPERSSSTESSLLQLLQRPTPSPPPPQDASQSLIALLNGGQPSAVTQEKPPQHPLIALLSKAQPKDDEMMAPGQP